MSFKQYIAAQSRCSGQWDFIGDAQRDETLPDAKSWKELRTYLEDNTPIPDAGVQMARIVWDNYRASRRRKPVNA